ncbi:MAG: TetR/AcrR family transcriptional regulator [Sandaracinus sp.]
MRTARKEPRQARSSALVSDVLEAAIRVLGREGPVRFGTVRVAREAGVSVGSLYQYFESKEALLFRLQTDEWQETWSVLSDALGDERVPPRDRLRRLVVQFFRSERQEARLRAALDEAGVAFRTSPEAAAHRARVAATLDPFFAALMPARTPAERVFAADFLVTTMKALAEEITSEGRARDEVDRMAQSFADAALAWIDLPSRGP